MVMTDLIGGDWNTVDRAFKRGRRCPLFIFPNLAVVGGRLRWLMARWKRLGVGNTCPAVF